MIKIWLVSFSNGEEWHICGEYAEVCSAALNYIWGDTSTSVTIKYLRWVSHSRETTASVGGMV
jgi:hypothetical protein